MPSISKQSPKGQQHQPTSSTANGSTTHHDTITGVKLLVYGRSKTGKTRLSATFPKPLLIVGTEEGIKSIATGKKSKQNLPNAGTIHSLLVQGRPNGIDFIRLTHTNHLEEIIEEAKRSYKSIALDHVGGFQDICLKEILGLVEVPMQRSWGMADQKSWQVCTMQLKEKIGRLLRLADSHGINLVITAHERNFGEGEVSDIMVASIGAALSPSAAGWLNGECDYICQAFIREKRETKELKVAGSTTKQTVGTGKAEYCLRVGPHQVFMTGFRLPPGAQLPDSIVDPTFDKIVAVINGQWNESDTDSTVA